MKHSISSLPFFILCLLIFSSCELKGDYKLKEIENPSAESSSLPHLYTDNTSQVFMSWVEETEDSANLKYSVFDGTAWSDLGIIASGDNWFLNWADFPSVIAFNGSPMAAHWLQKIPGNTYSYNIHIATPDNNWDNAIVPHDDSTATEHGFVSMIPASDSTFVAVWLDGRNTEGRSHDEYSNIDKAMTLRSAFLNTQSEILQSSELDANICDCCNTSITKTESGYIVAYRDRTADEIRDIYTISYSDGDWKEPKRVHADNWNIAACPVNGPAIQSLDKYVGVSWFTGAGGEAKVKMSISSNNGDSFSEPLTLDAENPMGRVNMAVYDDLFWVSWIGKGENGSEINITAISVEGNIISTYSIPGISDKRSSGFPQISSHPNGLLVAYTDVSGEIPEVKTFLLGKSDQ